MRTAICPGSFDPITMGHLNIIQRSAKLFDKVIVCISVNSSKSSPMFAVEEKVELVKRAVKDIPNVEVVTCDILLARFARQFENPVLVKGLRAASDFEYEFQMDLINKNIDHELETLFMPSDGKYTFLSSSVVREMARYGASLEGLVPDCIIPDIENKAKQWRQN